MIPMRLREMTSCSTHKRSIIVLEDANGGRTLTIATDPDESCRLSQELSRGPDGTHVIYDFLDAVLRTCHARLTRVMLEYVPGEGLAGSVSLMHDGGGVVVPCYVSDAVALA